METVIVIGGGASGLIAAITASEDKSRRVILLERQQRIGRKLLATGNGRCNLTNTGASPENYHGEQEGFATAALNKFTPAQVLDFFHGMGLVTVTEYGNRVYPLSNSANSVVDVLRFALEKSGVELHCACPARAIERRGKGYVVITDEDRLEADYVIVACGGAAGAKLGGVMDGYQLLKPLGHKRTALRPALVQLLTAPEYPRALKGIRADGELSLCSGGETLCRGLGEVQFTEKGLSGPAAFDVSRAAACAGEGADVTINFFRAFSPRQLMELLCRRRETFPELPASELFTGMLHNRLGRVVVSSCAIPHQTALPDLSQDQKQALARAVKAFPLPYLGSLGMDCAQVTAGGIVTREFDPETLESRLVPGLYACGEVLDIDGDCGGYNLQWAWSSGYLAGKLLTRS